MSEGRAIKSKKTAAAPPLQPASTPLPLDELFHLPDFQVTWECPNCGQRVFGVQPPDLCDYCRDLTTWRRVEASSE